ncbi:MAG: glycosyltransferase family 39 protein [Candidatus Caldarchaeales archaeon]|jgi:hypothetical protein|nr:glycosyltransferase family 39 protein [Candidatus Caldarchaeales archaeon]
MCRHRWFSKRYLIALLLVTTFGFTLRYSTWIYPGWGASSLIIFDVDTYTVFGIQYIENIKALNITALAGINTGVPPLGMILTGLTASTIGPIIGHAQAGLLAPILASSLTTIPTYMLVKKRSHKAALVAASLTALDPFLIQYSTAYLDSIGTLFAVTSVYCLYRSKRRRDLILAAVFASMAVLTKLTFLILIIVLALFLLLHHQLNPKRLALYMFPPIISLSLNPWLWIQQTIKTTVEGHLTFNNIPLSPIVGPFVIGVPQSLPWYILSYLGMGQVFWNTLPFITPLVTLAVILYRALQGRLHIPANLAVAASASVLTMLLLPRNYWTANWSGMLQGVLARQFYPYYFYPVGPFLAMLAAQIAFRPNSDEPRPTRLAFHPIVATAALAPLAVVMNLGFPYWDFIFTLIYNYSQGQWLLEGAAMIIFTAALTAAIVILAEYLYRRDTNAPQPQLSTKQGRPNKLLITKLPLFKNHL